MNPDNIYLDRAKVVPPAANTRGTTSVNLNYVDPEVWLRRQHAARHELADYNLYAASEAGATSCVAIHELDVVVGGNAQVACDNDEYRRMIPEIPDYCDDGNNATELGHNAEIHQPSLGTRGITATSVNLNDVDPEVWLRRQHAAMDNKRSDFCCHTRNGAATLRTSMQGKELGVSCGNTAEDTTNGMLVDNKDIKFGENAETDLTNHISININNMDTEEWLIKQHSLAMRENIARQEHGSSLLSLSIKRRIEKTSDKSDCQRVMSNDDGEKSLIKQRLEEKDDTCVQLVDEDGVDTVLDATNAVIDNAYEENVFAGILANRDSMGSNPETSIGQLLLLPQPTAGSDMIGDNGVPVAHVQRMSNLETSASTGFFAVQSFLRRDVLVIDGELTQEAKNRQALRLISCVVLTVITVVVVVIISAVAATNSRSKSSPQIVLSARATRAPSTSKAPSQSPSPPPKLLLTPSEMLTFTLEQGFVRVPNDNPGLTMTFKDVSAFPLERLFTSTLLRRDKNFTVFGLNPTAIKALLARTDLVDKLFKPQFTGHLVSYFHRCFRRCIRQHTRIHLCSPPRTFP
jgi:hypothetical protein